MGHFPKTGVFHPIVQLVRCGEMGRLAAKRPVFTSKHSKDPLDQRRMYHWVGYSLRNGHCLCGHSVFAYGRRMGASTNTVSGAGFRFCHSRLSIFCHAAGFRCGYCGIQDAKSEQGPTAQFVQSLYFWCWSLCLRVAIGYIALTRHSTGPARNALRHGYPR